jgi:hypothetical protein
MSPQPSDDARGALGLVTRANVSPTSKFTVIVVLGNSVTSFSVAFADIEISDLSGLA